MKQRETTYRNLVMISSFIYSGISFFLFVIFFLYLKYGKEFLFIGRLIGHQNPGANAIMQSLVMLIIIVTGFGAVVSFLSGLFLLKSGQYRIQQVVEVNAKEKVKEIESKAEDKVKKVEHKVENEVSPDMLLPDEKKLIKILEEHDCTMTQRDLVRESELSKVKVHRVLKKLEMKKIVTKYEFGMTNRIRLEKKLRKV